MELSKLKPDFKTFKTLVVLFILVLTHQSVKASSLESSNNDSTIVFTHESCQLETASGNEFTKFYSTDGFVDKYGAIEFVIRFKGESDGHVFLTENANDNDPLYLIVLGSYDNKMSEIRRSKWGENVSKMITPGILSFQQFRGFLIRYNRRKGELKVFAEGSDMPLLYWIDSEPLYIRYFSFSAYVDKIVQIAFNCKPTDQYSFIPSIQLAERNDLLANYDKLVLPRNQSDGSHSSLLIVNLLSLTINYFKFESSILEIHCLLELTWKDDRLVWDIEVDNDTQQHDKQFFSSEEIWTTDITTINSILSSKIDTKSNALCVVHKDGTVYWRLQSKIVVACNLDLKRWPKDTQKCSIKLGSWAYDSSELNFQLGNGDGTGVRIQNIFASKKLEWKVVDTEIEVLREDNDCCPQNHTIISYNMSFQRRSSIYTCTITLPIILISFVNLGMFLVPLDSFGRVIISSINFFVLCIYTIFFRIRLPEVDHVPYIVVLYGWNMILAVLNILAQAFLSQFGDLVGSKSPPNFLSPIYNASLMTVLGIGHLNASKQSSTPTVAVVRSFYKRNNSRSTDESDSRPSVVEAQESLEWGLLAASLNRISFVAYTTVTLVLLACLI